MFLRRSGKRAHCIKVHAKVKFAVEKNARPTAQIGREAMNDLNNEVPIFVTRARASYLLGIPEAELRRISEESGVGQLERAGNKEEMYFTYEELRWILQFAYPGAASH
jgi:hypothetical protein